MMVGNGPLRLLQRRIDELDRGRLPTTRSEFSDQRLVRFVSVMQSYTSTSMGPTGWAVIDPAEGDDLVGSCRLIAALAQDERAIVDGPLCRNRQHWIATAQHALSEEDVRAPTESRLIDCHHASSAPSPKPFGLGLFTSTAAHRGHSMWRTYLDMFRQSSLTPRPWSTWHLDVPRDVGIVEIGSASDWATFVQTYPQEHAGMIYPNWPEVSRDFSGVHVTARAVAAAQGFCFPTRRGLSAPAFWDTEQTLWLRWVFGAVTLVDVTHD